MATIFDAPGYLEAKTQAYNSNPEHDQDLTVAEIAAALEDAGFTPLSHYQAFGEQELADAGITFDPFVTFDADAYIAAKTQAYNSSSDPDLTEAEILQAIQDAGMTPLSHYQQFGQEELADAGITFPVTDGDNGDDGDTSNPGEEIFLTNDRDIVEGTGGDDTFVGTSEASNGLAANTLNTGDYIDGNGGNDVLDATLYAESAVGGGVLGAGVSAVGANTDSVETVNLTAKGFGGLGLEEGPEFDGNDTVYVDAIDMNDVTHLNSVYSRANVEVLNVQGREDSMGTADMHFGMDHTGSADSHWDASNMTVLFDQDDLLTAQDQEGYFFQVLNQQSYDAGTGDILDFPLEALQFKVLKDGETTQYTLETNLAEQEGVATQQDLVDLLNSKLEETDLDGASFSVDGNFTDDAGRTSQQIVLTLGSGEVVQGQFQLDTTKPSGNIFYAQGDLGTVTTPVETNVELTKVGASGDGGGMTIGSMNKGDGSNSIDSGASTNNNTVAGIQTFNVTVHGGNQLSSSLAYLQSTNNVLETVNIDSAGGSEGDWADLEIGNVNTGSGFGEGSEVFLNAQALKDVSTLDASAFNGDLSVTAGLTDEFGSKYALFDGETTAYDWDTGTGANWSDAAGNPTLTQFDPTAEGEDVVYTGGDGNDTFTLAISDEVAAASHLVDGGVSLSVNGGKGDDVIDIDGGDFGGDNNGVWTLNGGLGDDTFDLSENGVAGSGDATISNSTIVFSEGKSANANGHDTIIDFSIADVTPVAEVQQLDLSEVELDGGETLTLTVDGVEYSYTNGTATSPTIGGTGLTGLSSGVFFAPNGIDTLASEGYTFAAVNEGAGSLVHTLEVTSSPATGNIGTITAEVGSAVVANGVTVINGGTAYELDGNDTLDFSSYNLDALTIDGATATPVDGTLSATTDTYIDLVEQLDGDVDPNGTYDVVYHMDNKASTHNEVTVGSITFMDDGVAQDSILSTATDANFFINDVDAGLVA